MTLREPRIESGLLALKSAAVITMRAAQDHSTRQGLSIVLAVIGTLPGLYSRFTHPDLDPLVIAGLYGLAVVSAAFLLAWGAEVAQLDISAGLAIAALALIAVLPEYAVDFVLTWKAGANPPESVAEFAPLALANMTGGNQLLIGFGWPLVVLIAGYRFRNAVRRDTEGVGPKGMDVLLDRTSAIDVVFLGLATIYGLTLALRNTLAVFDAIVLVGLYLAYLFRLSKAPPEVPHLVGPAQLIGKLADRPRRITLLIMLVFAAGTIIAVAEPFAEELIHVGEDYGIDEFLLIKWVAPLASESPELIVAGLFAWRLQAQVGLGALVSSKVNQWTLLVGTLPLVFAISSSSYGLTEGLPLGTEQRIELFVTAAQSAFAVAVVLSRSISLTEAGIMLVLFFFQFVLSWLLIGNEELSQNVRLLFGVTYLGLAAWKVWDERRFIKDVFQDGFVRHPSELID